MIYSYSPELATLFYMDENDNLCGLVEYKNTFNTEDWFMAEDTNEFMDEENIKDMHNKIIAILKRDL